MLNRLTRQLVARGKPLVPSRAWPLVHAARSMRGSGPVVGLPKLSRVLVVCAHPDDEIACAGTVALLCAAGCQVSVHYASRGEATRGSVLSTEQTGQAREVEARLACEALGVASVYQGSYPDGRLEMSIGPLGKDLSRLANDLRPEVVLGPWPLDGHADHRAVYCALAEGCDWFSGEYWGYEWWTPAPVNRLVDVTAVIDRKVRAAATHKTASGALDVEAMIGLSRYRSLHGLMGEGFAEGFMAGRLGDIAQWVSESGASTDDQ